LPQNVVLLHIIAGWGPLSVSGLIFLAHMSLEKNLGLVGPLSGAIAMGVLVTTVRHVAIGIRRNTGKHWGEAFALAVSVDMTAVLMEYAALSPQIKGWYSTVAIVLWVAAICFSVALCVHAYRAADPARHQGDENGTR
jgi:hypothetical protein